MDFGKVTKIEDYRAMVNNDLYDLDIGILILNAGICEIYPIRLQDPQRVQNGLAINILHVVYLSQCLMSKLIARKKRSAILVTGSGIRAIPTPGMVLYSATKHFVMNFCQSIGYELNKVKSNVDVVCYEPATVKTKMVDQTVDAPKNLMTPERAAQIGLRDLGTSSNYQTQGMFSREFM